MAEELVINKDSKILINPLVIVRGKKSECLVALLDNSLDFYLLKGTEYLVWQQLMDRGRTLGALFEFLITNIQMNRDDVSLFLTKYIRRLNSLNLINIAK